MSRRRLPRSPFLVLLSIAALLAFAGPAAADDLTVTGGVSVAVPSPPDAKYFPIPPDGWPWIVESNVDWKQYFQKHYPIPEVEVLPQGELPPGPKVGNQGEGCVVTGLWPGQATGTQGCGPCVGVIVVSPPTPFGTRTIWVFHFSGHTDAGAVLAEQNFPPGSHMIVFGGDCEGGSRATMRSIKHFLEPTVYVPPSVPYGTGNTYTLPAPVIFDGYYNTPALLVDCDGRYLQPYGAQRCCENDGSCPRPDPTK